MLKLLLNHWHAYRESPRFVLTDDPLYCAHLSTSQLPEVYAVNRVNPIFEEDEEDTSGIFSNHKRTLSENDTRSSDDTGYVSGRQKSQTSIQDDAYSLERPVSTSSEEPAKSVTVSADVHRESKSADVIVLPANSRCSFCGSSISSSTSSPEPYDSLTAPNFTPNLSRNSSIEEENEEGEDDLMKIGGDNQSMLQTKVKRPFNRSNSETRAKLEKLLTQGNQNLNQTIDDSTSESQSSGEIQSREEITETKSALIDSLNRVFQSKVPKSETTVLQNNSDKVTRTDSTYNEKRKQSKAKPNEISPPEIIKTETSSSNRNKSSSDTNSVDMITRRDESLSTNSNTSSNSRRHHHKHHKHNGKHRNETTPKPITLHQLLPGHWSYDNIYLPQMPGICYHCLHRHPKHPVIPIVDSNFFLSPMYHNRTRHSWAPRSTPVKPKSSDIEAHLLTSSSSSDRNHHHPDDSQNSTESDRSGNNHAPLLERRSLRVPKKCKCEECIASTLESDDSIPSHYANMPHMCPCCYFPNRKVKFASEADLPKSHMDHVTQEPFGKERHPNGDKTHSSFNINIHRLNGHVNGKAYTKQNDDKLPNSQSSLSRGKKEPIMMDNFRTYPINFQDWEAQYKRKFLHRKRKRALNMIGMAIGIILVIGVAIAMTFIFLRLKRPT